MLRNEASPLYGESSCVRLTKNVQSRYHNIVMLRNEASLITNNLRDSYGMTKTPVMLRNEDTRVLLELAKQ